MPTSLKGGIDLRRALKKFTPDLAIQTQKELVKLVKPVVAKARGFVPADPPLSGWANQRSHFPFYNSNKIKAGITYSFAPSKVNNSGFRALARIINKTGAGAIYETAGRVHPQGRPPAAMQTVRVKGHSNFGKTFRSGDKNQSNSNNPNAGKQFMDAINKGGGLVDANSQTGAGRRSRKMKGRLIFRAWAEDQGRTQGAVIKAIEASKANFYKAVGLRK